MDYRRYEPDEVPFPRPHPVWRGIGCLLMVVIPIMSFAMADLGLNFLKGQYGRSIVPAELRGEFALTSTWVIQDIWAVVALTVVISFALYALLAVFNAMIYGATKNRNLNALNAPPERYRKKKRR